ncbi:tripartite tricarboxylate transporter substrate binding protein [Roseomonas sp. BN140053]|uniref:tripartite tricarboxylate transporter substrate binding protein n=1 Tax=Roseomonas sp. BN140053 TaxID=3391898 RepID=UPI0039EBB5F7
MSGAELPRRLLPALLGALPAALARPVLAQQPAFPARPITVVVPYAPGGLTDVLARLVAEKLRLRWGQPVVIENRPGAGGILGARTVAAAAPDGHTVLLANTNIAVNPSLYRQLPYDTATAFAPLTLAYTVPNLILVHAGVPARTLAEMIALARARPEALNYASAGNGSLPHLVMVMLLRQAGIGMTHIPFNGAAPAMAALLGRQVDALASDPPGALPNLENGSVRALAISSRTRLPSLPEVPTVAESGLPGFEGVGWQGFMVPAGTPPAVAAQLHEAIVAALRAPEVSERLSGQGVQVVANTAEEFAAFLRRDTLRWREVVQASGVVLD